MNKFPIGLRHTDTYFAPHWRDVIMMPEEEHEAILAAHKEAIKVAMEALTNASLYADKDDVNGLAGGIAKEAKQKIEEILK